MKVKNYKIMAWIYHKHGCFYIQFYIQFWSIIFDFSIAILAVAVPVTNDMSKRGARCKIVIKIE